MDGHILIYIKLSSVGHSLAASAKFDPFQKSAH
jgi:hypothetical protein